MSHLNLHLRRIFGRHCRVLLMSALATLTLPAAAQSLDYGDAPASYGSPSHGVSADPQLYLGTYTLGTSTFVLDAATQLDTEASAPNGPDADGDDNAGIDDEAALVTSRRLLGTVSAEVALAYASADPDFGQVPGIDPADIRICGWLDSAGGGSVDGDFTAAEGQCLTAADCGFDISNLAFLCAFEWSDATWPTYARFRVSTDALTTSSHGGTGTDLLNASDGEIEDYFINQTTAFDGGDAPGTTATPVTVDGVVRTYGQAPHDIDNPSTYYLGTVPPDAEATDLKNVDANGDDNDPLGGPDDEDGATSIVVDPSAGTATATVTVTNSSGGAIYFYAFIDGGQGIDGVFGSISDRKFVTIPAAGGTFSNPDNPNGPNRGVTCSETSSGSGIWICTVTWDAQDDLVLAPSGTTYLRFRVAGNDNEASTSDVTDGEAEDYRVDFTVTSDFDAGDSPSSYGSAYHRIPSSPTLYLGGVAPDAETIASLDSADATGDNTNGTNDEEGVTLGSFAPDLANPGYFFLNPSITVTTGGVTGLADSPELCAWLDSDLDGIYAGGLNQEGVCTDNTTTGQAAGNSFLDYCSNGGSGNVYTCTFPNNTLKAENQTGGNTTFVRFRVTNGGMGTDDTTGGQVDGEVEDYGILVPPPLIDQGDAPSGYGAATHTISPRLYLGSTVDGETTALASTNADGDDTNQIDDEDGVASFPAAPVGGQYTVTVSYRNTGAVARLCGWIDFDQGGTFDADERACADVSSATAGSEDLVFTVPADASGNTNTFFARFRLAEDAAEAETPTGTAASGEVEDYSFTIDTYTVSGILSGLVAGDTVVLQNNGGDNLTLSADGAFTFPTPLVDGSTYSVTVLTQPPAPRETCTVTNGSGTLAGSSVNNVSVTCTLDTFTVGGTLQGLAPGNSVVLQNNGADDLTLSADGPFTFSAPLADGTGYAVSVLSQPDSPPQICTVTNGSGTLAGADVVDVTVACSDAPLPPARAIPTLSAHGLALTVLGLVLMGFYGMRSRIRPK